MHESSTTATRTMRPYFELERENVELHAEIANHRTAVCLLTDALAAYRAREAILTDTIAEAVATIEVMLLVEQANALAEDGDMREPMRAVLFSHPPEATA